MRVALHDRQQIAAFLSRDPGRYLYESGDLDPFFWPQTLWFGWQVHSQLEAICLLYTGDQIPILLALGNADSQSNLLQSLSSLLPATFYAHLAPGLELFFENWEASGGERYHRMLLDPAQTKTRTQMKLKQALNQAGHQIRSLGPEDLERLQQFYAAAYPQNWFNPRMLITGQYLGWFEGSEILAVAGVHVFSPAYRIAALGNIAVSLSARGKGLGQMITAALCKQVLKQVEHVGLNVSSHNQTAIACYQKIGFEIYMDYREWCFTRPLFSQSD